MQKVFAAKNQIDPSTKLCELAYQFDFTDSAHFSRQFKRFVGVSPRTYKKQLQ
ncbi:MAG: helix-turn-helix domain-containing protein [Bacteroidota bacterium]